jgi:hypothetical protein
MQSLYQSIGLLPREGVRFDLVPEVNLVDFYGNRLRRTPTNSCTNYYDYGNLRRKFEVNNILYSSSWCCKK